MHLRRYAFLGEEDLARRTGGLRSRAGERRFSPPWCSMQFGGKAIEVKNERMFNCAATHIHSPRPSFAEFMFLSLCGTGVGIGLRKKFIHRLPDLVDASDNAVLVYTLIEDNIEGWADSIEALLNCYFRANPYFGEDRFRLLQDPTCGAPLKTSGDAGLAPGYTSLKAAHAKSSSSWIILSRASANQRPKIHRRLRHPHALRGCGASGYAARRRLPSSEPEDTEMMTAKTGDWRNENPQRARSEESGAPSAERVNRGTFPGNRRPR